MAGWFGALFTVVAMGVSLVVPSSASVLSSFDDLPANQRVITICMDDSEWAPYEYFKRVEGEVTSEVVGLSVDVLNEIFSASLLHYKVVSRPWKRCLRDLEVGVDVQMVFPTSLSAEREAKFLGSNRVYEITPSYFYLKQAFPYGVLIVEGKESFRSYRVCGRFGYNYENFGFKNREVHRHAPNYQELFYQLAAGRCDVVLARLEIVLGQSKVSMFRLSEDIGYGPIPNVEKEGFYFLVSRQYSLGDQLIKLINAGIQRYHDAN